MTWGNKLLVAFIGFAILMSTLVYKCSKHNFDLVSKDYYKDELRYQDKIDGINNASTISEVQVRQNPTNLVIALPIEMTGRNISGDIWFYCATNAKYDRKIKLAVDNEGRQFVNKGDVEKTNYTVKINWKAGDRLFYSEKFIAVQ